MSASPTPSPNAVHAAARIKLVLFNIYFIVLGAMLLLMVPLRASLTPLRADIFVDKDDFSRFKPNLKNEPYTHDSPAGLGVSYKPLLISTNAEGFRDRDHTIDKPAGTFRIATFGDSFFFGLSVEQHETVASQIETVLNQSGTPHYETLNFGIPGLNFEGMGKTAQAFGVKYHLDMAVFSFICDDISATDALTSHHMGRKVHSVLGDTPPMIRQFTEKLLSMIKMSRYTIDYRTLTNFPPLYRQRATAVLGYLHAISEQNGAYDIVVADYCRDLNLATAIETFNREHGAHIHHVRDFEVELNNSDHHPTARSNRSLAERLRPLVQQVEARRAAR